MMKPAVPSSFPFPLPRGHLSLTYVPRLYIITQAPLFLPSSSTRLPPHPAPGHASARDVSTPRASRRGAHWAPGFRRCCRRRRRRPRLLSQDGGSSGRVLQCGEPGVVPDVPGAAAAGRGGSFRLPVQNAGFKYPSLRGARGRAGVSVWWGWGWGTTEEAGALSGPRGDRPRLSP